MKVKHDNGIKEGFRFELGRSLAKLALTFVFLGSIFIVLMIVGMISAYVGG
jgi:hypothetical protein